MRILVTGATGFIGYNFVKRLIEKGKRPVCQVRSSSKTDKLSALGIEMIECDIRDRSQVDQMFSEVDPEMVFHCAAIVWHESEEELFDANVNGTLNITRSCFENKIKRLIYISSIAVVNGNEDYPLKDDLSYNASALYGESKIEAEKIVLEYRAKGLSVAILRPCMVFGEGEPHAMEKLLRLVNRGIVMLPAGNDFDEKLQLAYIDNVVYAMELASEKDEALSGTFFVADKEIITVRSFLSIIAEELGKAPLFVMPGWMLKIGLIFPYVRNKFNRIFKNRVYDISNISDILGYDPQVTTEEGLRRTVRAWKDGRWK